eukprot:symbB.v1.2.029438.t1/scaffold3213.1/size61021/3
MNHQFFPWWFVRLFRILPLKQRPGTRYSEVAPAVRDFRAAVLDVAKGTKVTVADAFEVDVDGIMKSWSIENDKWMLDIWVEDKRFNYKSMAGKEVALSISDGWAAWLEESGSGGYP